MIFRRKHLNILLLLLAIVLGVAAVRVSGLPSLDFIEAGEIGRSDKIESNDSVPARRSGDILTPDVTTSSGIDPASPADNRMEIPEGRRDVVTPRSSGFKDIDPHTLIANHPFRAEALKIINSGLEESDSVSRRKILSYCEHLRVSYTTKDLDFLRQVFSDNALIIVGNVIKTGKKNSSGYDAKVAYAVRSKQSYLDRLSEIFSANETINVDFTEFHIMRHPSMKGIYGVSLRQKYCTGKYSDDGYLFLLWDFRNASMPLIHVRTWQPHTIIAQGEEVIDISDFNIE